MAVASRVNVEALARRNGWTPERLASAVGLDPDRVHVHTIAGIVKQAVAEGDDIGWVHAVLKSKYGKTARLTRR